MSNFSNNILHKSLTFIRNDCFKIAEVCFPFPRPVSLRRTSTFCWGFYLLAVICTPLFQKFDVYVVVLQLLQHIVHCPFIRMWASKRHIHSHCKQIIGDIKTNLIFVYRNRQSLMTRSHISTVAVSTPNFSPQVHSPIIPSFLIQILHKYTLRLYIAFGSAKNWLF